MNLLKNKEICSCSWSPAHTVVKTIEDIIQVLIKPYYENGNRFCQVDKTILSEFKNEPELFAAKAREWTEQFAM